MVYNIGNTIRQITTTLSQIFWRWDKNFGNEMAVYLHLTEKEKVRGRITYSFLNDQELSAYFNEQECLERIEVPIFVHWETEFLIGTEYETILNDFYSIYEQAVDITSSVLGSAKFNGDLENPDFPDEFDVLKVAIWNIYNARLIIYIEHQDREVPIVIAIGVLK